MQAHTPVFDSDYISAIVKQFDTTDADIIGGVMETKVLNETPKSLSIVAVLSNKFGVGNSMFRVGIDRPQLVDTVPFGIYKTELLKSIGGYDVRLIRNHDIEMSKRILAMGHKILLLPKPKCYYYARENFYGYIQKQLPKRKLEYQNGVYNKKVFFFELEALYSASFSFEFGIALIIELHICVVCVFKLVIACHLCCIGVLAKRSRLKKENPKASILYAFICFFVLHFGYGLGSLLGLLSFKKLF